MRGVRAQVRHHPLLPLVAFPPCIPSLRLPPCSSPLHPPPCIRSSAPVNIWSTAPILSRGGLMTESDGTELRRTMIVVVFGGLMSMLDATIVNIAIRTLSVRLHVPLSSVQWVVTGYLLALAAVIPVAGWIAASFGPRR